MVGAGPAGVAAALAARRQQSTSPVYLFSEEDRYPYEKPPLSKAILTQAADPEFKPIVSSNSLSNLGIEMRRSVRVIKIDRCNRRIYTDGFLPLTYSALVLATGSRSRELPTLPRHLQNVFYLRTADDALRLRTALRCSRPTSRIVVIGAGLIGLEVAATTPSSTIVVEAGSTAMMRVCSADLASFILERHRKSGVEFLFQTVVEAAEPAGNRLCLKLQSGVTLEADLVIVGIGAMPNLNLAKAANLPTREGILVDEQCRTVDPAIFAAGDVAEFYTRWCCTPARLENWRHALDQGEVAGVNAAGGVATYDATPSFWSDQCDLFIQGVGWSDGLAYPPLRRVIDDNRMVEFHTVDNRVRYAVGIGASRELSIARRLIERQSQVVPDILVDQTYPLQKLLQI